MCTWNTIWNSFLFILCRHKIYNSPSLSSYVNTVLHDPVTAIYQNAHAFVALHSAPESCANVSLEIWGGDVCIPGSIYRRSSLSENIVNSVEIHFDLWYETVHHHHHHHPSWSPLQRQHQLRSCMIFSNRLAQLIAQTKAPQLFWGVSI